MTLCASRAGTDSLSSLGVWSSEGMHPPLVRDAHHLRPPVWSMCTHPRRAAAAVCTMKGVWRCDARNQWSYRRERVTCRHWNVHNGHRRRPARIDVRCLRCGSRHQHVPRPRDGRGRRSRMRYVRFPHDVDLDILVNDCARRNRNGHQLSNEFVPASELPNSEIIDSEPESEIVPRGASDPGTGLSIPSNVNDTPPLIVRVWRWIVTFLR